MMKKHADFLAALLFVVILLSGTAAKAEEPLPFPGEEDGHDNTLKWKRSAADSALRIGLSGVAASLYEQLLAESGQGDEYREGLLLGLATAQLSEGRFPDAEAILAKLKDSNSPRIRLRQSLLAYHRKDSSGISSALEGISEKDLPMEEKGWFHLMKGIGALEAKNRDLAQSQFDNAMSLAVGETQKTEFLVLRYQAEITTGIPDEVLAVKLKQQWEKFKDKSAGYDFAIEYASVLQALDRPKDAITVIESQLKTLSGQQPDKRAHLLLTLGLLDQDPTSIRGRSALEELVEQTEAQALAKVGLRILASRFNSRKDNGAYVDFIDRLLSAVTPHPLRENLLLLRAHAALGFEEDDSVEKWCLSLMQEYPASPWKLDVLRVLAATAWRTNPPKYRAVANYLNQIRATEEEAGLDFSETSLLMADCHFLAKDYENASSAYQNLLGQECTAEIRSKALFQYVQSLIELGNLEQAAANLANDDFGSKQLSSWWRAEWNLVAALKEREGTDKAFARIRNTLNSNDKMPEAATIRLTWLQAQLSLDLEEVKSAPELTEKVMAMLQGSSSLEKDQFDVIRSQTLLTKGQALLRLKRVEDSFAVFKILRSQYPKSEQAALSYLLEANHHSANNHLVEAQRILVTLAERFPKSEYAPRALYEASINAERRGLPESLQNAVRLLEDMAANFPNSELLFYARLKQGHLLRNLNDYEAALDVYEEILRNEIFSENPDLPLASLSKADCMFAIARTETAKLIEAAERYSDLLTPRNSLPIDLRVEAGFKRALCLRKADKTDSAKAACWEVIQFFVESDDSLGKLGGKGCYWAARTIFELGEMLDREGSSKQALEVYELIRRHGLPGGALATARAGNGKD